MTYEEPVVKLRLTHPLYQINQHAPEKSDITWLMELTSPEVNVHPELAPETGTRPCPSRFIVAFEKTPLPRPRLTPPSAHNDDANHQLRAAF